MLRLDVSESANRFLERRQIKHQRQIIAKVQDLRTDPYPVDSKVLKGTSRGLRRADAGEYRMIYRVKDDFLHVLDIGKRNDDEVYRRFRRR